MGKVSGANHYIPFGTGSSTQHPASTNSEDRDNREYLGQFTHVMSNRAVNEIKVGFSEWNILQGNLTTWSNHWARDIGVTDGHPRVQMVGMTIAGNQNAPRIRDQNTWTFRDDFTSATTRAAGTISRSAASTCSWTSSRGTAATA